MGGLTRREALKLFAGAGAAAWLGAGCATARPTQPPVGWSLPKGRPLLLANAVVVDVDRGSLRRDAAVLIRDGLIAGLVDPGGDPSSAGARVVDCRGGYLIPGLINAHSHINMPSISPIRFSDLGLIREQILKNYEDAVCWGVTTVRDMTAVPKMLRRDREAIARGDLLGPRILSPFSFITVPGGYPDFGGVGNPIARWFTGDPLLHAADAADCRRFVRQVREQGADLVKIGFDDRSFLWGKNDVRLPVLSDAQVEAVMDEAAKVGLPVSAHHLYSSGLDRGLQFGVNSLEHVPADKPISDRQMQAILEKKIPFVPTLMVGISMAFAREGVADPADPILADRRNWRDTVQLPEVALHCLPEIAARNEQAAGFYRRGDYALPENRGREYFDPVLASRLLVMAADNTARLIRDGATIGVGNDSGVFFIYPGMVHLEMECLCRLGLTPAQALRAATLVNARLCRIDDRCGTIDVGKWADLTLLTGDPLADVANAGKVRAVFKQGELVSAADGFIESAATATTTC